MLYSLATHLRVCAERDALRAACAREEARALAAEAELARVRAGAERVRVFYEEREAKLKARIGGEMLRAERAEAELLEHTGAVFTHMLRASHNAQRAKVA